MEEDNFERKYNEDILKDIENSTESNKTIRREIFEFLSNLSTKTLKKLQTMTVIILISAIVYNALYTLDIDAIIGINDNDGIETPFSGSTLIEDDERVKEICDTLENELQIEVEQQYLDEYLMLNAIYENANLSDKDKNILYGFIDVFKDNQYINKKEVYARLKEVSVECTNRPENKSEDVVGSYDHDFNKMEIYYKEDGTIPADDEYEEIMTHEGGHCIFKNIALPRWFDEGVNELSTMEYFLDDHYMNLSSGYIFETTMIEMLCEVTSPDTVLRAFTLDDISIITNEIANIIGNETEAQCAMESINTLFDYKNNEQWEELSNMENAYFFDIFRRCINQKYPDENDPNHYSYSYNEQLFKNIFKSDPYRDYYSDIIFDGIYIKPYFSSELIEKDKAHMMELTKEKERELVGYVFF